MLFWQVVCCKCSHSLSFVSRSGVREWRGCRSRSPPCPGNRRTEDVSPDGGGPPKRGRSCGAAVLWETTRWVRSSGLWRRSSGDVGSGPRVVFGHQMLAVFGALWFLREKVGRGRAQSTWKRFSRTTGNEAACFLDAESLRGFKWQLSKTVDEMKAVKYKGPASGSGNP